ncbi:MAG: hypothetical protein AB7V62_03105 [Thermoleophilia bacterium]
MILRVVVAAVLALAAWTGTAAAATGSVVGVQPLDPEQSWIVRTIAPGQSVRAAAVLVNLTGSRQAVELGTADGVTTADGVFTLAGEQETPVDVGAWIEAPAGALVLAPHERRVVRFRVEVPPDAAPGDHAGGLVVRSASRAEVPTGDGLAVKVVERVGLRVYVTVSGPRDESLLVEDLRVATTKGGTMREAFGLPGSLEVSFRVRHAGNVRFDALSGRVAVSRGGGVVREMPFDLGTMLPRGSREMTVGMPLDTWSPGDYDVAVWIGDAPAPRAAEDVTINPLRPMATGGMLLAVVGAGLWSRRRRAR